MSMAGTFLDLTGLTRFHEKMLELVDVRLAGKQDAGEYLTPNDIDLDGLVTFETYGDVRDRDSSKPTYGLK